MPRESKALARLKSSEISGLSGRFPYLRVNSPI
jgi:hypothetical protein